GKILIQESVQKLLDKARMYSYTQLKDNSLLPENEAFYHPSIIKNHVEFLSFLPPEEVKTILAQENISFNELQCNQMNLEDTFIGLTGKY
ncbi:MAG: ABC transporter ATP-binding protein, partial [Bacteroidales bacterium]|nr:ABC transporter ATP-binding protein [Bacteroidales bacterium]